MIIKDITSAIESVAPLSYQDDFDNSGLQVGCSPKEIHSVLVCLDITEDVVDEAIERGADMIVSHHPLIFKALQQVADSTYQQRCVVKAITHDIAVYSAHTSLDNAPGGVNHRIADILHLSGLAWLSVHPDGKSGSGLVGTLESPLNDEAFYALLKDKFGVKSLRCSRPDGRMIRKVAVCGGAGAFLLRDAIAANADCFVCGEFHYHDYFENSGTLLAELGHYQSEQFTIDLICDILSNALPELEIIRTNINTNPTYYL